VRRTLHALGCALRTIPREVIATGDHFNGPLFFVIPAKRVQPFQKLAEVQGFAFGSRKVAAGFIAMLFGDVTAVKDRRQLTWILDGGARGNFPSKREGTLNPAASIVKCGMSHGAHRTNR
jgi:hypothetical protein